MEEAGFRLKKFMALATKLWVNRRLGNIRPDLQHPRRLEWPVGAMDYSGFAFGFSISGAVVTVNSGEVHPKKQTPIVIASKEITLTADHQYIGVEHVLETSQAVIQGPGLDRPVSDDIMYRVWLHQFRFVDGVASLERIGHLGNIYIFGNY